jgi:UDP-N-acetylglucosamine/UDP-N-acetylgalactosamine diphosphorylase
MPAVDLKSGKLLLEAKDSLALSPDGHGGTLAALARHGCLQDIQQRGIEQLFYFQVDNPLTQICDPQFIGYHLLCGSEMSTQAVAKRDPAERVGVIVAIDGKVQILEYSDLPAEHAARRDADGSLWLWAGNTAIHVFDVAFLERMQHTADALPFHRAKKKVPFIDEAGQLVEPEKPNAIKFERFIFDLLPHARHAIVVEVDPAEGFAPVKNASGEPRDTPETARAAMIALHRRWLREAGARVGDDIAVEISPQFALDAKELKAKIRPGTAVTGPKYFAGP